MYAILQDVEAPNSRYLYVMKVSAYGGDNSNEVYEIGYPGLKKQLVLQYIPVYLGCFMLSAIRCIILIWKGIRQNQFIWMEKRSRC